MQRSSMKLYAEQDSAKIEKKKKIQFPTPEINLILLCCRARTTSHVDNINGYILFKTKAKTETLRLNDLPKPTVGTVWYTLTPGLPLPGGCFPL